MGHPSIPILSLPSFHPRKVKAKLIITKWTKFYATAWRRNYLSTWIRSSARHIRVVDVCFEASQPQIAQPNCARRMPFLARFFKICTLTLVSPFSSWDVPYHTSGWNAPPPPTPPPSDPFCALLLLLNTSTPKEYSRIFEALRVYNQKRTDWRWYLPFRDALHSP